MRRITLFALILSLGLAIAGCKRTVQEVQSIDIDWTPQLWYIIDDVVALGAKEITVHYDTGDPDVFRLDNPAIEIEGNGINLVNYRLQTAQVGKFDIKVSYEGSSIEIEYFVDWPEFTNMFNAYGYGSIPFGSGSSANQESWTGEGWRDFNILRDTEIYQKLQMQDYLPLMDDSWTPNNHSGGRSTTALVGWGTLQADMRAIGSRVNTSAGYLMTDEGLMTYEDFGASEATEKYNFNNAYEIQQTLMAAIQFRSANRFNTTYIFGDSHLGGENNTIRHGAPINWNFVFEPIYLALESPWLIAIADEWRGWDSRNTDWVGDNEPEYPNPGDAHQISELFGKLIYGGPVSFELGPYIYTHNNFAGMRNLDQEQLRQTMQQMAQNTAQRSISNRVALDRGTAYGLTLIALYEDLDWTGVDINDGGQDWQAFVEDATLRSGWSRTPNPNWTGSN